MYRVLMRSLHSGGRGSSCDVHILTAVKPPSPMTISISRIATSLEMRQPIRAQLARRLCNQIAQRKGVEGFACGMQPALQQPSLDLDKILPAWSTRAVRISLLIGAQTLRFWVQ
jgi:hypothetical protein